MAKTDQPSSMDLHTKNIKVNSTKPTNNQTLTNLMNLKFIKNIAKKILFPIYTVFNLFYFPILKYYFVSKIEKIPRFCQLFFMTRFDFGTWLLLMHYAGCWHRERGPVCLVIFIPNSHVAVKLAKVICPNVEIIAFDNRFSRFIFSIFRRELIQYCTLNPIYAYACCRWPHALFIFDMTFCRKKPENISCYISAFDPALKKPWPFSKAFLDAYLHIQRQNDNRKFVYQDMIQLFYQFASKAPTPLPRTSRDSDLLKKLIIGTPYVVMNLNCKDYLNTSRSNRSIHHPERYNSLIDFLIAKGYIVVIQGRNEQPQLAPRKGLIEYFKSSETSPENDYRLFTQCSFAIMPKTGPEVFATICNVPVLGLNYVELATINPKIRCRFFPKHVWDSKKRELIHWKDLLKRPCFFNVGIHSFEEGLEYIELDEEELIYAAEEFLQLMPQPFEAWMKYTSLQKEFKQSLHPAHIDLYDIPEVPCETYLSSPKYN